MQQSLTRHSILVSVIIPTYRGAFLAAAVRSVLDQSLSDFEIIVIDDGSPADVPLILGDLLGDPRVQLIRQPNAGATAARNHGARNARGAYIAFLDDDDLWEKDKLRLQVAAMANHPEAGLCFCDGVLIDEDGSILGQFRESKGVYIRAQRTTDGGSVLEAGELPLATILRGVVITSSVLMKKEIFDAVGGFTPDIGGEDIDLACKVSRITAAVSIDAPLFSYRVTGKSLSRSGLSALLAERSFAEWMNRYDLAPRDRRLIRNLRGRVERDIAYEHFRSGNMPEARASIIAAVFRFGSFEFWSLQLLGATMLPASWLTVLRKGRRAK